MTLHANPSARSKICFDDVSKAFGAGRERRNILEGISLSIEKGQFVSIIGESGCGKTTLLRIAAGLIPPTTGQVSMDGSLIKRPRRDMGFVFQQPVLLDWRTILDNVLLPVEIFRSNLDEYRPKAIELLSTIGLAGFENHYPAQLSGGMQQRVSIARSLILGPSILMMDEPFGALDAITRDQMNMELQRIWSATSPTVLFITHDIAEAAFLSDRVVVLHSRPGGIRKEFNIDLPRPRKPEHRFAASFTELCRDMKQALVA